MHRTNRILLIIFFTAIIGAYACQTSADHGDRPDEFAASSVDTTPSSLPEKDAANTDPLYPFTEHIRAQLDHIDTTPYALEKTVARDAGQEVAPTLITPSQLRYIAQVFLEIDPNQSQWRPYYTEHSFTDLSINTITFTIKCIQPDLPLQQADVLLHPETHRVKHVILKRILRNSDSTVVQNLLWVHNRHLQISEWISPAKAKEYNRITRVVWQRDLD